MKKIYVSPSLVIIDAEATEMICSSKKEKYSVKGGSKWGGEGEYAPADWINEGHGGKDIDGYSVVYFGDEGDDDLESR